MSGIFGGGGDSGEYEKTLAEQEHRKQLAEEKAREQAKQRARQTALEEAEKEKRKRAFLASSVNEDEDETLGV